MIKKYCMIFLCLANTIKVSASEEILVCSTPSKISRIRSLLDEGTKTANVSKIQEAAKKFMSIESDGDLQVENWSKQSPWPHQTTLKQIIGGLLFFSDDLLDLLKRRENSAYLKRRDILERLKHAASFGHTLAQHFSLLALISEHPDETQIQTAITQNMIDLQEAAPHHPFAAYLVGKHCSIPRPSEQHFLKTDMEAAKKYLKMAPHIPEAACLLVLLNTYQHSERNQRVPLLLSLSDSWVEPFIEASWEEEDAQKRELYLQKAAELSPYGKIALAEHYERESRIDEARHLYKVAAHQDVIGGAMALAKSFVGDLEASKGLGSLGKLSPQQKIDSEEWLNFAKVKGHPSALIYFIRLYSHEWKSAKEETMKQYMAAHFLRILEESIAMGLMNVVKFGQHYFPSETSLLLNHYGQSIENRDFALQYLEEIK